MDTFTRAVTAHIQSMSDFEAWEGRRAPTNFFMPTETGECAAAEQARSHLPCALLLLRATEARLKPFTLARLRDRTPVFWRVLAYDGDGNIVATSPARQLGGGSPSQSNN